MEESNKKHVTILLGPGLGPGEIFEVVGQANGMAEARRLTRSRDFVSRHLLDRVDGAYVLLVSGSGHQAFIPISALGFQSQEGSQGRRDTDS